MMYGMLFGTLPRNTLYSTKNEEDAILIEKRCAELPIQMLGIHLPPKG